MNENRQHDEKASEDNKTSVDGTHLEIVVWSFVLSAVFAIILVGLWFIANYSDSSSISLREGFELMKGVFIRYFSGLMLFLYVYSYGPALIKKAFMKKPQDTANKIPPQEMR